MLELSIALAIGFGVYLWLIRVLISWEAPPARQCQDNAPACPHGLEWDYCPDCCH